MIDTNTEIKEFGENLENGDIYFALLILEERLNKRKDALTSDGLSDAQKSGLEADIKLIYSAINKIKREFNIRLILNHRGA